MLVVLCRSHFFNNTQGFESDRCLLSLDVYPSELVNLGKCGMRVLHVGSRNGHSLVGWISGTATHIPSS